MDHLPRGYDAYHDDGCSTFVPKWKPHRSRIILFVIYFSWRVLDVSVAMTYAMLSSYGKSDRSISAACAVLRGFHSVYALTAQERRHLRLLIACRLATSATLGNFSYKQVG